MLGLGGGLLLGIEGEPHHERQDPALVDERLQPLQVGWVAAAVESGQCFNGEAQGITAGEADAFAAHVQRKDRSRSGRRH